jgi:hypothetical protein
VDTSDFPRRVRPWVRLYVITIGKPQKVKLRFEFPVYIEGRFDGRKQIFDFSKGKR